RPARSSSCAVGTSVNRPAPTAVASPVAAPSFPHAAVFTVTWSPGTAEEGYTSRASAVVPAGMPDRWSAGAAYAGATSTPAAATASTVPVSGRAEPRIDAPSSSRTGRGPRHPHVPPSIASLLSEVSATRPGPLPEGVSEGGLNGCQGERAGPGARRVSAGHRRRRGPAGADTGKDTPRDGERVTGPPALADGPGAAPRRGRGGTTVPRGEVGRVRMRMRARTGVLLVLWAVVTYGLVQSCGGMLNNGGAAEVRCPGVNIGADGEEHPPRMRPGETCYPHRDSRETRSYAQQRDFQRAEGEDIVTGAWFLAAGALG